MQAHLCSPHPSPSPGPTALIGSSAAMQALRAWIVRVARHGAPVLLMGETGTGKDVVAQHLGGQGRPYVPLNCGALGAQLIESELFGHERGAFTGAVQRKLGAFEAAHRGTLLLDEIGELPLELQARLLRVLESGEVRRVGSTAYSHVQVRVVAATNRCLEHEVRRGRFRSDLFHRLHVLFYRLPPLRERHEDIPALVGHFLSRVAPACGPLQVAPDAMAKLQNHAWPGNIRELRNVLERAAVHTDGPVLAAESITFAQSTSACRALRRLGDIERASIARELRRQAGNRKATAAALGISRSTLHRRLSRPLLFTPGFGLAAAGAHVAMGKGRARERLAGLPIP